MRHKSFIRLLNCIWALRFRGCQRNNLLIIEGPLFSGHTGFAAHKIFGHFFSSSKLLHNIFSNSKKQFILKIIVNLKKNAFNSKFRPKMPVT